MTENRLPELFDLYIQQRLRPEDEQEFMQALLDPQFKAKNLGLIDELFETIPGNSDFMSNQQAESIFQMILLKDKNKQPALTEEVPEPVAANRSASHFLNTTWLRYAAIVLLIAGAATFLYLNHLPQKNDTFQAITATSDILPGGNKAVLTLSDGTTVLLEDAANGAIAQEGHSNVIKRANGQLVYEMADNPNINTPQDFNEKFGDQIYYNTITTPTGGQYRIMLPDGSIAWLNAASSIRFPVVFAKERKVTITGEVYLEVAADKGKPFLVSTNAMEVQVLGTSFNINAYSDEPAIKTTLLDGSIKVFKKIQPHTGIILKPHQQAVISDNITINKAVDVEQVIAWKNGVFNFNGSSLEEFMRQISRWYDLKIIYEGNIPQRIFKGEMGRDLQLSQIMELLTQFKIKYKREGNTITIESQ